MLEGRKPVLRARHEHQMPDRRLRERSPRAHP
jgi:hypothetical protein